MSISLPQREPWYSAGLQFTCTGCGNCCTGGPGFIWINSKEIDRLAEFLKLTRRQVIAQYCRRIGSRISLNERKTPEGNYDCVFLKEIPAEAGDGKSVPLPKRICTVYPVRPLQCRTWPFWSGNLESRAGWERASKRCPGMDSGRRYTREQIEALRDAEEWPEVSPGRE